MTAATPPPRPATLRAGRGTAALVVALSLPLASFVTPGAADTPSEVSVGPAAVTRTLAGGPATRDREVAAATPAPVRLQIAALGVDAPVDALGLDGDGALAVPDDRDRAGWWSGGVAPGAAGPAVIAGHVALREGPGVFRRLGELEPGAEVRVHRRDGSVAVFTVTAVTQVAKQDFPVDEVYGPTPEAQLRLITCGGAFDPDTRVFLDNVIVSATLRTVDVSPTG